MLDVNKLCAWSIRIEDLYLHAVVYRSTRALRLIRLRQRKVDHGSLQGTFDFASIPQEIFELILNEVTSSCTAHALTQPPFVYSGCSCELVDEVWASANTKPLFDEWCIRKLGRTLDDIKQVPGLRFSTFRSAFQKSPQWAGLQDQVREASDVCRKCKGRWMGTWETMALTHKVWNETLEGLRASEVIVDMLKDCLMEIISLNEQQYHLVPEYDQDDDEDWDLITDYIVHNLKRMRIAILPQHFPKPLPRALIEFNEGEENHMLVMDRSYKWGTVANISPLFDIVKAESTDLVRSTCFEDDFEGSEVIEDEPSKAKMGWFYGFRRLKTGWECFDVWDYLMDSFESWEAYEDGL